MSAGLWSAKRSDFTHAKKAGKACLQRLNSKFSLRAVIQRSVTLGTDLSRERSVWLYVGKISQQEFFCERSAYSAKEQLPARDNGIRNRNFALQVPGRGRQSDGVCQEKRKIIQDHAGIDLLLNEITADAVETVQVDVVFQETERGLNPPAHMVQHFQCLKVKGSFRKVGQEVYRAFREINFNQADREMKQAFPVRRLNKVEWPVGTEADKLVRMVGKALFPAACGVEFQRNVKLSGNRKMKAAEERMLTVWRFESEKEAVTGKQEMCQKVQGEISPVGDEDRFSGKGIVV